MTTDYCTIGALDLLTTGGGNICIWYFLNIIDLSLATEPLLATDQSLHHCWPLDLLPLGEEISKWVIFLYNCFLSPLDYCTTWSLEPLTTGGRKYLYLDIFYINILWPCSGYPVTPPIMTVDHFTNAHLNTALPDLLTAGEGNIWILYFPKIICDLSLTTPTSFDHLTSGEKFLIIFWKSCLYPLPPQSLLTTVDNFWPLPHGSSQSSQWLYFQDVFLPSSVTTVTAQHLTTDLWGGNNQKYILKYIFMIFSCHPVPPHSLLHTLQLTTVPPGEESIILSLFTIIFWLILCPP